jgi:hypothetical protein
MHGWIHAPSIIHAHRTHTLTADNAQQTSVHTPTHSYTCTPGHCPGTLIRYHTEITYMLTYTCHSCTHKLIPAYIHAARRHSRPYHTYMQYMYPCTHAHCTHTRTRSDREKTYVDTTREMTMTHHIDTEITYVDTHTYCTHPAPTHAPTQQPGTQQLPERTSLPPPLPPLPPIPPCPLGTPGPNTTLPQIPHTLLPSPMRPSALSPLPP